MRCCSLLARCRASAVPARASLPSPSSGTASWGRAMSRVMSFVMTVFIMLPVVAPTLGSLIAQLGSWQPIFMFLLGFAALTLVWVALRLAETNPRRGPDVRPAVPRRSRARHHRRRASVGGLHGGDRLHVRLRDGLRRLLAAALRGRLRHRRLVSGGVRERRRSDGHGEPRQRVAGRQARHASPVARRGARHGPADGRRQPCGSRRARAALQRSHRVPGVDVLLHRRRPAELQRACDGAAWRDRGGPARPSSAS